MLVTKSSPSVLLFLARRTPTQRHFVLPALPFSTTAASTAASTLRQSEDTLRPPTPSRLQVLRNRLAVDPMVNLKQAVENKTPARTKSAASVSALLLHPPQPSLDTILAQLAAWPTPTSVLTDTHQRHHSYLRISLSERCNLRCRYCMPPEGVPLQPDAQLLQRDEILRLATIFTSHGVDKIRLTGGEPLLRKDLVDIVGGLGQLCSHVGMTTNGVTLSRQLDSLVAAGLTHINISLDALKEDKFLDMTRRPGLHKVYHAIEHAAATLPHGRVKINCVVMKDVNEDELMDFCLLTKALPVDVRFIEWMPFNNNGWNANRFVSYQSMMERLAPLNLQRASDGPNDTTKWWTLGTEETTGGSLGRIGFITSMSQHFCGTCNRLRLTADGQIKVCLFGSTELSLRDAMRAGVSQEELEKLIYYAVQKKHAVLGGHGTAQGIADANDNRPMTLIGG